MYRGVCVCIRVPEGQKRESDSFGTKLQVFVSFPTKQLGSFVRTGTALNL